MKDMVVLLPGILGSVLQKDGLDIWNILVQAATRAIREIVIRRSLLTLATSMRSLP
ncbi:MAG: hypothetical protein V7K32_12010 [Nostoc sp.]|uniref:hypothetical protein n=1 Tax=Nostoc sp. TaxID=1180 RepID=UPI002FF6109B